MMKIALHGLLLAAACAALVTTAFADRLAWRPLSIDGYRVQWQRPGDDRLVLTYRILERPEHYADAVNCDRMTTPRELLAKSQLSTTEFRDELVAAFRMWERVANVGFVEADPDSRADIHVGAQVVSRGRAFTDVAFDRTGTPGERPIKRALVCLNPEQKWKTKFDGDLGVYDLRYTLAHEIGHAIGLDHPDGPGTLMWFKYAENTRTLQGGDIEGAVWLYGPPRLRSADATSP